MNTKNPDALVKFAVTDIVNKINAGSTPQEATEKVARELELNVNFIKRASEAVNVALHYNHFKKHANEKADTFPIVDAQVVTDNIFGKTEKTASQFKSEEFSSFQTTEITPKFARYLEAGPHKVAYEKILGEKAEFKFPLSEQGVYAKSASYIRDLKKTAEDKEAQAQEANFEVSRTFCNILEKFAKVEESRAPFEEFESQAYSTYGEKAVPYLDLLYKTSHLKEARGKHDTNYKMFSPAKETISFGTFLKKAEVLAGITKEAEDAKHNYEFEKKYVDKTFKERGCDLFKQAHSDIDASLLDKIEADMKKEAEQIDKLAEEDPVIAQIKQKRDSESKKVNERIEKIAGYLESVLGFGQDRYEAAKKPAPIPFSNTPDDNRERAFMLQELSATDPILSKLPTHKVVDAYQQMLRISPELSKEKEIVRSFLRSSTAGQAIDPFMGGQLIDANTSLLKQHRMERGLPSDQREAKPN